jgi:hypothetical protein
MKAEYIREIIHRAPFQPLELALDNGKKVLVKHSDFILFAENNRTVIVTEGDRFHFIDLDHVSAIESKL